MEEEVCKAYNEELVPQIYRHLQINKKQMT